MAKKAAEIIIAKTKLQDAMDRMNKLYGVGTVMKLDDNSPHRKYEVISSGSIGIDHIVLGTGGFAKGKLYELMGWEGCLAEDTYIKFITVKPNGVVQDCKGSTIKHLYDRFHNRNNITEESEFNVVSINEEDRVFRNPILNVVKSGTKECFEVVTSLGFKIKTTKDHKFYTGDNYVALENLVKGDHVFVHNNTPYSKKTLSKRVKYESTTVKWYYKGKAKCTNGCYYYRVKKVNLLYEAYQNNISYEEYKQLLNVDQYLPDDFWTIPEGYDLHHIDENTRNNEISNLQLLSSSSHDRLHAISRHNNLRFIVCPDDIISITSVGMMETYDISCEFPYNNFIAEGIVVHNSGKSTVCGHAIAECQKAGKVAACIDGEGALDPPYFESLGIDLSKLILCQPNSGDEGFNVAIELIKTGEIDLLIIDSDSSLIPKSIMDAPVGESTIGKKARLNSDSYPKLKNALVKYNVCVIVTSQYREKIGLMYGNPTTTQGGHALKFYTDCRIEISKSVAKEGDVAYGNTTKMKATKNKMSPPYRVAQFDVVWGKGIDKFSEVIDLAIEYNIVTKAGSWFSYGEIKIGQGKDTVITLLNDNPELFDEIRQLLINKLTHTEDLPTDETSEEEIVMTMTNI